MLTTRGRRAQGGGATPRALLVRSTALGRLPAALAALWVSASCAPSPSTVPLGLGPLAVAEAEAEQARAAEVAARRKPPTGRARPEPAATVKAAPSEAAPSERQGKGDPAADEPATAAAPGEPAFEGLYAGHDIAVFKLSGFPEREQRDDKAKIRMEKASGGNVSITLINSEDGSDLCELLARVEGNAAVLESAQPCFSDGGEGSLEAELTSGRAVLEGDRLKMEAEGTLSVSLPDQELDGQLTYSFDGERQ